MWTKKLQNGLSNIAYCRNENRVKSLFPPTVALGYNPPKSAILRYIPQNLPRFYSYAVHVLASKIALDLLLIFALLVLCDTHMSFYPFFSSSFISRFERKSLKGIPCL